MRKLKPYFYLLLLCAGLYLPGIYNIPAIDRDETHFAQATRQMLETGNYFQIRYQDTTRSRKPPGINWLQAIAVKLFSTPEAYEIWPYRLPSTLSAICAVLLTFAFVRHQCGQGVAIYAAAMLACSLLMTVEAHVALTDAALLVSIIIMQGTLWLIYTKSQNDERVPLYWAIIFWLALSCGFVLKGVTPLVGGLTVLTLVVIDRKVRWLKNLHCLWGVALFALSCSWLLGVNHAEHSNYLLQMFHKDLLPKLRGGHESHGFPPGSHLAILCLTMWPASLFLWPALRRGWQFRKQLNEKFLLAWLIPTWIFFEIMPTKLPQYVLPTFPALAILIGLVINHEKSSTAPKNSKIIVLYVLWLFLTLCLASVITITPLLLQQHLTIFVTGITLLIIVMGTIVFRAWKKHYTYAAQHVIFGSILGSSG